MKAPYPSKLRRTEEGIEIVWQDGHRSVYQEADLRRLCPCATCQDKPPRIVANDDPLKLIDDVPIRLEGASQVGRYAFQFYWNDNHKSGIYSYEFLRRHCPCNICQGKAEDSTRRGPGNGKDRKK